HSLRSLGSKDFPAEIAAQPLQLVYSGINRYLPFHAHQHAGIVLQIYSAALTIRALVSGRQPCMPNLNSTCFAISSGAITSVSWRCRFASTLAGGFMILFVDLDAC